MNLASKFLLFYGVGALGVSCAPPLQDLSKTTQQTAAITSADFDQDGVSDAIDNCIAVNNPLQTDLDIDGIGDVCDTDVAPPTADSGSSDDSTGSGTSSGAASGSGTPSSGSGAASGSSSGSGSGSTSGSGSPALPAIPQGLQTAILTRCYDSNQGFRYLYNYSSGCPTTPIPAFEVLYSTATGVDLTKDSRFKMLWECALYPRLDKWGVGLLGDNNTVSCPAGFGIVRPLFWIATTSAIPGATAELFRCTDSHGFDLVTTQKAECNNPSVATSFGYVKPTNYAPLPTCDNTLFEIVISATHQDSSIDFGGGMFSSGSPNRTVTFSAFAENNPTVNIQLNNQTPVSGKISAVKLKASGNYLFTGDRGLKNLSARLVGAGRDISVPVVVGSGSTLLYFNCPLP
ncbi:MAG: hypothetical protein HY390_02215 [Deltaproteobacteria bacterium]|nr:hypothetical protein [Deltaproteobacteria bacterium]